MSDIRAPNQKYLELRDSVLNMNPQSVGISVTSLEDDVWCVLMETGMDDARYSLLFLKDGNSSVYLDNGGAVIGGFSHQDAVAAVKVAIAEASQYLKYMIPTKDFPLVDKNQVQFLLLTGNGPFMVDVAESVLANNEHDLSKFYGHCHQVLAALREKDNTN